MMGSFSAMDALDFVFRYLFPGLVAGLGLSLLSHRLVTQWYNYLTLPDQNPSHLDNGSGLKGGIGKL